MFFIACFPISFQKNDLLQNLPYWNIIIMCQKGVKNANIDFCNFEINKGS